MPVVLVPVLVVVLVRLGRRRFAAFAGGGAIVFLLLWLPVVVSRWHDFREQVLGYSGNDRQWGLPQFLTWAHLPGVAGWLAGPGRFVILLVSGLTAAALAWRRPGALVPAVGTPYRCRAARLELVVKPAMYAARAQATAASSCVRREPISMHGRPAAACVIREAADAIALSWL